MPLKNTKKKKVLGRLVLSPMTNETFAIGGSDPGMFFYVES